VGLDFGGSGVLEAEIPPPVILLDTNALLWLDRNHPRSRPLTRQRRRLYVSPASLLEIQLLTEVGRVRLRRGTTPVTLSRDERWLVDSPPSIGWFEEALALTWTRDPFDRLLVAHARTRGWRLATADAALLDRLGPAASVEL
jgi:PIN domain nuclease of toxin-antitoxin system